MTPDELPADMEGLAANLLADLSVLAATARGVPFDVWDRFANNVQQAAALLKAYQEQRRALSGLLGFMGQLSPLDFVNALYWHETPGLELTTHEELVANLDEAIAAGFAALATRAALNQKGDGR